MREGYEIVPATVDLALQIASRMREADKQEVWAAMHHTPEEAVLFSLQGSGDGGAWVGTYEGTPLCAFGCGQWSVLALMGMPWLLTSEDLGRHTLTFMHETKRYIEDLQTRYSILQNYVDARHEVAIRWLEHIGFILDDPIPFGVEQIPFHRFHWETK